MTLERISFRQEELNFNYEIPTIAVPVAAYWYAGYHSNGNMGYVFAHVMGTIEGGIESLPGTECNADFNRGTDLNSYQRTARGNVAVVLKDDPSTEPLRAFLLATVRSCQELYSAARRLGLPETSVRNKLPWYR